jgi:hypothetical protein
MPELSVTESQLERLETVRAELEAEYVVGYGHVRREDAFEYLLDTYTPPASRLADAVETASYDDLQRVATTVDGVPGSGIEKAEMRERLVEALGRTRLAGRLAEVEGGDDTEGTGVVDTDTASGADAADVTDDTGADGTGGDPAPDPDSGAEADSTADGDGGGGGSPLQAVAQLLEDNDDVWRESDGETRYEVDLPDGTTEPCRTRDDVKRLLFKHYR